MSAEELKEVALELLRLLALAIAADFFVVALALGIFVAVLAAVESLEVASGAASFSADIILGTGLFSVGNASICSRGLGMALIIYYEGNKSEA